jgi:hypothetical protein
MNKLITILTLLISTAAFSQYKIEGKVIDENDSLVPFSNVIILNPADSSIVKGEISQEGSFSIENISLDKGLIKVSALGFEVYFKEFDRPSGESLNLGSIQIQTTEIKGVEIVATRPIFVSKGDRIVVDVENSALSDQGSAFDVLRSSPKILIGSNDNITVIGKGSPMIYIDNQPVNSIEILKSLPSSEIKSIEIIENPSAKYDAAGAAVILINTKKQNLNGYQIRLLNNTKIGRKVTNYTGINADYKKGKFGIQGFYGFFFGNNWSVNNIDREVYAPTDTTVMDNDVQNVKSYPGIHSYKLSLFYNPDSVSNINFKYNGHYKTINSSVDNVNILSNTITGQQRIYSNTKGNNVNFGNTFQLNYSRDLDTNGSLIYSGLQYSQYNGKNKDSISENNDYQYPNRLNLNNSNINFASAKIDYEKKWAKNWGLDVGAKYTYVFNKGESQFGETDPIGNWIGGTPSLDADFNYNEHILAGYIEGSKLWKKVFMRIGVRSEWTRTKGNSSQYNLAIADTGYINFFPSFLLTWDMAKNWKLNLNYNRRINRPSFQDMTPYVDYVDSLSAFIGNPYLTPSYAHEAEFSIVFRDFASIEVGYTYEENAITLFVEKDPNSNAFIAQERNIDYQQSLSVGLNLPYQLKWWTTYNGFGMNYNMSQIKLENSFYAPKKPMFYVYLYNKLAIPKTFDLEITYVYHSSGVEGIFEFFPSHNLSVSISRKFLDNKLNIRLSGNDLLRLQNQGGNSRLEGYNVRYQEFWDSFNMRISISYTFGKLQKKGDNFKSKFGNDEKDRIKN